MAKEKKKEGFHSAAGLIRYFDSEDEKALKIPPWMVLFLSALVVGIVVVAAVQWPV